jgi:hypothetical protein
MTFIRIALAGTLLLTGTAATAQTVNDAQCIILSNLFAKESKEPQQQKAAEAAVYFYLGRVRDGTTAAQLKTVFDQASKPLTQATIGPKMNDCVNAIQTKVQLLQSLAPAQPAAAKPGTATPQQKKPDGR